jgi:hypothetical protein
MKTYREVGVYLHLFLPWTLGGGECRASRPCRFNTWGRATDTRWIGGSVGARADPDAVEKRKSLAPAGNRTPASNPSLYQLRYTMPELFYTVTLWLSLVV